jgi:hypothetical protein
MKYPVRRIIYPEGDTQEIEWQLSFGDVVDVSGRPLSPPLPTVRMLAYRVYRINRSETRNEYVNEYHLEQLFPDDLRPYVEA